VVEGDSSSRSQLLNVGWQATEVDDDHGLDSPDGPSCGRHGRRGWHRGDRIDIGQCGRKLRF